MFFFSKFGFRSSSSSSYGYDPQKTRDEKDLEEHHEQFEQMLKGDCILVQFGENLESMFIKAGDVNPNAKRLMRAIHTYSHRESSIKLAVTLPEVSRLMYETYVTWDMSVGVTALTFRWGKLILLAQTTKLLEDVESHRKTLDSMIAKGEQCKYIKHLLFQPEDWSLLRKTLHAGALCDDLTRKVVAELLKRSDGLKELLCITAKELEQMGITWEETCIVEATVDGIGVEPDVVPKDKNNTVATSNVEYVHNTEVTSIAGHEQAQDDDEWEILSITGSHSDDGSIAWESDDSEDEHLLVTEPAIDADDWIIAPQSPGQVKTESQIDEHGNSSHRYGPKTQIGNNSASGDENASNAPVRSADDIAKHYRGLAADDAGVSVGFGEQQDASQEKDSHDKDGGVVIQQNCVPRYEGASPVESLENPSLSDEMEFPPAKLPGLEAAKCASLERRKLPSPLKAEMEADLTEYINSNPAVEEKLRDETGVTAKAAVKAEHDLIFAALKGMPPLPSTFQLPVNSNVAQAVPTERPETIDRNDIAGFVTTKDLPRTVPTSLMKVDANGKEETRVDEEEEEAILLGVRQKVPGSRRRGWKRQVSEDVNLDDNVGRKHARHHQTKRPTSTKRGGGLGVKQKNSVLNALHEEQVVSSPASPNTTNSHVVASINLRQPKEPDRECRGSPASDRELEENKRKDLEAWPENLAIDTPPLAGKYLEKGAH